MTNPGGWVEIGRVAAPLAICFASALLVLHILLSRRVGPLGDRPFRGLAAAMAGGAATGTAVWMVAGVVLGQDPLSAAALLFVLSTQLYLLALAACLSSWRLPLAEVGALLLFVPATPLQLLVHAGVLPTPGGLGPYLLPPASFMLDLPAWAVGTWSRAGWNPFSWPRGMAGPGFGTGALVWVLHVGILLGLATWGRHRHGEANRNRDPGPPHSSK